MDKHTSSSSARGGSLRTLADTCLSILRNRLELFALELQEERQWLIGALIWGAATLFLTFAALVVVTITVIFVCPEGARAWVLLGFSLLYILAAVTAGVLLRRKIRDRPPPLSDSITELKKDLSLFHHDP